MSRIAPHTKLFQITQTQGMSCSTAVHSTCGVIVNPPSPQTETQARSGAASLAPRMPLTPNPMPRTPTRSAWFAAGGASQNCMNQLWCTPKSSDMIASSGNTLAHRGNHRLRPQRRGVEAKFGR